MLDLFGRCIAVAGLTGGVGILGDTSTLADPEVVTKLVKGRRNRPNRDAEDWVG